MLEPKIYLSGKIISEYSLKEEKKFWYLLFINARESLFILSINLPKSTNDR